MYDHYESTGGLSSLPQVTQQGCINCLKKKKKFRKLKQVVLRTKTLGVTC